MDKMALYNTFRQPPTTALKKISGGRMNGKTDINPQWRIEALTQQFGPCGTGWYYEIIRFWLEPVGEQVAAFSQVNLYYVKEDGEWSKPIPGIGGSMLAAQEKSGIFVSDECYKMATTDAISVAFKFLGGAGDIYAGKFDGSKYADEQPKAEAKKPAPEQMPVIAQYAANEGEYPLPLKLQKNGMKTVKDIPDKNLEATAEWANKNGYPDLAAACKLWTLPL